jgi:hypothetical protein
MLRSNVFSHDNAIAVTTSSTSIGSPIGASSMALQMPSPSAAFIRHHAIDTPSSDSFDNELVAIASSEFAPRTAASVTVSSTPPHVLSDRVGMRTPTSGLSATSAASHRIHFDLVSPASGISSSFSSLNHSLHGSMPPPYLQSASAASSPAAPRLGAFALGHTPGAASQSPELHSASSLSAGQQALRHLQLNQQHPYPLQRHLSNASNAGHSSSSSLAASPSFSASSPGLAQGASSFIGAEMRSTMEVGSAGADTSAAPSASTAHSALLGRVASAVDSIAKRSSTTASAASTTSASQSMHYLLPPASGWLATERRDQHQNSSSSLNSHHPTAVQSAHSSSVSQSPYSIVRSSSLPSLLPLSSLSTSSAAAAADLAAGTSFEEESMRQSLMALSSAAPGARQGGVSAAAAATAAAFSAAACAAAMNGRDGRNSSGSARQHRAPASKHAALMRTPIFAHPITHASFSGTRGSSISSGARIGACGSVASAASAIATTSAAGELSEPTLLFDLVDDDDPMGAAHGSQSTSSSFSSSFSSSSYPLFCPSPATRGLSIVVKASIASSSRYVDAI